MAGSYIALVATYILLRSVIPNSLFENIIAKKDREKAQKEIDRYKKLLYLGVIEKDEFSEKAKELKQKLL